MTLVGIPKPLYAPEHLNILWLRLICHLKIVKMQAENDLTVDVDPDCSIIWLKIPLDGIITELPYE